jgi:hypothetical protein
VRIGVRGQRPSKPFRRLDGAPQEAVAQLDVLIDRLIENYPPGHPRTDPTMQDIIAAHIKTARDLRAEITGENPPRSY